MLLADSSTHSVIGTHLFLSSNTEAVIDTTSIHLSVNAIGTYFIYPVKLTVIGTKSILLSTNILVQSLLIC